MDNGIDLERSTEEGDSPVCEIQKTRGGILSRAGPEESCLKPAAPSAKAKHSRETDSVPVP